MSSPSATLARHPPTLPGTSREGMAQALERLSTAAQSTPLQAQDYESTMATMEYMQACRDSAPHDISLFLNLPPSIDQPCWLYEFVRLTVRDLGFLLVALASECDAQTCPKMQATESWMFLCAQHGKQPKTCTAMDYALHTITACSISLNSQHHFPNRLTIPASSVDQLGNMCRRLYRIFAHAYCHHRETFDREERATFLTRRFVSFVLHFKLMNQSQLMPPIELPE